MQYETVLEICKYIYLVHCGSDGCSTRAQDQPKRRRNLGEGIEVEVVIDHVHQTWHDKLPRGHQIVVR